MTNFHPLPKPRDFEPAQPETRQSLVSPKKWLPSTRTALRFFYFVVLAQLAFVLASGQVGSSGFCQAVDAPKTVENEVLSGEADEVSSGGLEAVEGSGVGGGVEGGNKSESEEALVKEKVKRSGKKKKAGKSRPKKPRKDPEQCYCQLSGKQVHDTNCFCDISELITYATTNIQPTLQALVLTDYFRFYKVNLNKGCALWDEPYKCATNQCGITPCTADDLPSALRATLAPPEEKADTKPSEDNVATAENKPGSSPNTALNPCPLSQVHNLADADRPPYQPTGKSEQELVTALSNKQYSKMLDHWDRHDKEQARIKKDEVETIPVYQRDFCPENEDDPGMLYFDLLKNPERYTGYSGKPAHRIWREIYEKNCYEEVASNRPKGFGSFMVEERAKDVERIFQKSPEKVLEGYTCSERRIFYRAVSGLHTSISIHVTHVWYDMDKGSFSPNVTDFERRFEHDQGETYIHNLYFVWLLQLRALHKASPWIVNPETIREFLHTGDVISDIHTQSYTLELLKKVAAFPMHFDESHLFRGTNADHLMEEFRTRMFNIQKIMDCVDCEKCRLWGKLQTHGLSTAVKILLTPTECIDVDNFSRDEHVTHVCPKFSLGRREIVSLINAFARLTNSVVVLEDFKEKIIAKKKLNLKNANKKNSKAAGGKNHEEL